jgi:hypothetical protein
VVKVGYEVYNQKMVSLLLSRKALNKVPCVLIEILITSGKEHREPNLDGAGSISERFYFRLVSFAKTFWKRKQWPCIF